MKDTCETCRWWDSDTETCRIKAPSTHEFCTIWPSTLSDDWCGDHEPDPALVPPIRRGQ